MGSLGLGAPRQTSGIPRFTLVHADHHWDGGYHPYFDEEKSAEVVAADLDQLRRLAQATSLRPLSTNSCKATPRANALHRAIG